MFTSKGLFSEIPCPHLHECHVPQCMFSHHVAGATKVSKPNPDEIELDLEDDDQKGQNGQRKRRRIDTSPEVSRSKPILKTKVTLNPSKHPSALTRNISPTIQRKTTHATSSSVKTSPNSAVKTPAIAPVKFETMRPRDLREGQKPPAGYDMRLRLIRAIHEHFVRLNAEVAKDASDAEQELVLSEQGLLTKVLDMELAAAGAPLVYQNMLKNKILLYKRMSVKDWVDERKKEVANAKATKAAITIQPSKSAELVSLETGLSPNEEVDLLKRIYTPVSGLPNAGYINDVPTDAEIEIVTKGLEHAQGWENCERCTRRFQIFPGRREEDGVLASEGQCTFHFGKALFLQNKNVMDRKAKQTKKYSCCGENVGDSIGCTQSDHHVFKIVDPKRLASVWNFVDTPENPEKMSESPVCIDGEMGYTVYGLELIRLTATSWPSGDEIFDVLVKPLGGVLDLNSRWSGVWPKDMAEALPWSAETPKSSKNGQKKLRMVASPQAARDLLFSHISPLTPLIGHGLENDLSACRVIHPTIIDTALLYPHPHGLPYRISLKNLMSLHLKRNIQVIIDGKMDGHDSKEDANAAGDLVRFALKNEWVKLKREGWTVKDGVFRAPTPQEPFLQGPSFFHVRETKEEEEAKVKMKIPKAPRKRGRDDCGERRDSFGAGVPTGPRKRVRVEESVKCSDPDSPPRVAGEELEEGELNYD